MGSTQRSAAPAETWPVLCHPRVSSITRAHKILLLATTLSGILMKQLSFLKALVALLLGPRKNQHLLVKKSAASFHQKYYYSSNSDTHVQPQTPILEFYAMFAYHISKTKHNKTQIFKHLPTLIYSGSQRKLWQAENTASFHLPRLYKAVDLLQCNTAMSLAHLKKKKVFSITIIAVYSLEKRCIVLHSQQQEKGQHTTHLTKSQVKMELQKTKII